MDGSRFDNLARSLASGVSRRSVLKGLLGFGGAAIVGAAVAEGDADAAVRKTPTPTPVKCPGQQTNVGGVCTCPPSAPNKCGPACCTGKVSDSYPRPPSHTECCDNACCNGTCLGEEGCCPTNTRTGGLPATHQMCSSANGKECCLASDECCRIDGCCDTFCYGGALDSDLCCPSSQVCAGGVNGDDICCHALETCCGGGTSGNYCADFGAGECCDASDCAVADDACFATCDGGQCVQHTCGAREVCCQGACRSAAAFEACPSDPAGCCSAELGQTCCGETCCSSAQCNEIVDVCCPDDTARCGTGDDACCADGLKCCLDVGKKCGECCNDDDCEDVVDFPNCMRSRCDFATLTCVLYEVCEEEGRVCCPGEEVGFCYSPDEGQCCTNDDCPGCDVCLHPSNTCLGDCPSVLSCCELGDDPDQWFCYSPNAPDACPVACDPEAECCGDDVSTCDPQRYHPDCVQCIGQTCSAENTQFAPCTFFPGGWCDDGRCHACIDNDFNRCELDLQCCSGVCSGTTNTCILPG